MSTHIGEATMLTSQFPRTYFALKKNTSMIRCTRRLPCCFARSNYVGNSPMNIQRKWAIRGMVVVIPLLLCVVVSLFLCRVNSEFSPFWVYDLGVCQDISPNGEPIDIANTFSVDTERIYAFFILDSKIPIRLKMRWYLENQLIV